jgi:hypothetical protein
LPCAWTASLWSRHGFARCQVLGLLDDVDGDPAATIVVPARPEQRQHPLHGDLFYLHTLPDGAVAPRGSQDRTTHMLTEATSATPDTPIEARKVCQNQYWTVADTVQLLSTMAPPARSPHLEQVRRIAPRYPPGLVGREDQLAELARFCIDPDGPPYAWWQADAWAGKSALLSSFVLRPPPEVVGRVRLVSFFITARLVSQDTRDAFISVVLEQPGSHAPVCRRVRRRLIASLGVIL